MLYKNRYKTMFIFPCILLMSSFIYSGCSSGKKVSIINPATTKIILSSTKIERDPSVQQLQLSQIPSVQPYIGELDRLFRHLLEGRLLKAGFAKGSELRIIYKYNKFRPAGEYVSGGHLLSTTIVMFAIEATYLDSSGNELAKIVVENKGPATYHEVHEDVLDGIAKGIADFAIKNFMKESKKK